MENNNKKLNQAEIRGGFSGLEEGSARLGDTSRTALGDQVISQAAEISRRDPATDGILVRSLSHTQGRDLNFPPLSPEAGREQKNHFRLPGDLLGLELLERLKEGAEPRRVSSLLSRKWSPEGLSSFIAQESFCPTLCL